MRNISLVGGAFEFELKLKFEASIRIREWGELPSINIHNCHLWESWGRGREESQG
jgi:hypothetical protein